MTKTGEHELTGENPSWPTTASTWTPSPADASGDGSDCLVSVTFSSGINTNNLKRHQGASSTAGHKTSNKPDSLGCFELRLRGEELAASLALALSPALL
eukprot:g56410.t1